MTKTHTSIYPLYEFSYLLTTMEILRLQGRKNNHIKLNQYYSLKQEFLNKKKKQEI